MSDFVHLHLHSQYSFLDGSLLVSDMVNRIVQYGMNAVALTDHGNMCGAITFNALAKGKKIKPIFGCEVYMAGDLGRKDRSVRESYHLVLLAENAIGFKNLVYLTSMGFMEGHYYNPRIDFELLAERSEGLIALTACLSGLINRPFLRGNVKKARENAHKLKEVMPEGRLFLELQRTGYPGQKETNEFLLELSKEMNLPIVATNDAHYLDKEHAPIREILLNIGQDKDKKDKEEDSYGKDEVAGMYLRSPEEMKLLFSDLPDAISNTRLIADMCNVDLKLNEHFLPRYPDTEGLTEEEYIVKAARKGLDDIFNKIKYSISKDTYKQRLEEELKIIIDMGFAGYFLIVADFIRYAKRNKISVGPGRGSGAGSLVAYALEITDLDPIRYDLLFERFLNPERKSLPDFDVDFCPRGRDEVIKYVTEKYGQNNVAQIITFSELKALSAVRDVARVKGLTPKETDELAKMVPTAVGKTVTFEEPPPPDQRRDEKIYALLDDRLKNACKTNPLYHEIITLAGKLGGCFRQTGVHAGGVVISDIPIWERVPIFRAKDGKYVTAYSKDEVEKAGLVKFDFLGLKNLTIIADTVEIINKHNEGSGKVFDIRDIPLDDKKTFTMISKGDTAGIFQLEGQGMTKMIMNMKPDCFEDIIAAVALYRPGPMQSGMMESYVNRKHGREKVVSIHPLLDDLLKETYGVIIYQEQVMRSAQILAGFSLGQADELRRAMGKKKADLMAEKRAEFVEGAVKNGLKAKEAEEIFDKIEQFAGYGFNKSHSAAYALISYQTAYLKRHYPVEFHAALISDSISNPDKVVYYFNQIRTRGIKILPPDINQSFSDFTVDGKSIRFGLSAIKGMGAAAIEEIIGKREEEGEYMSIFDFASKVNLSKVNSKVLELLINSGAFDSLHSIRGAMNSVIQQIIESGNAAKKDKLAGQNSLFGGGGGGATVEHQDTLPNVEEWPLREKLLRERACFGFFLSAHPLDEYKSEATKFSTSSVANLQNLKDGYDVSIVGIITEVNEQRGTYFVFQDTTDSVEVRISQYSLKKNPGVMDSIRAYRDSAAPVLLRGNVKVSVEGDNTRVSLWFQDVKPLEEVKNMAIARITLNISHSTKPEELKEIKELLIRNEGKIPVNIRFDVNDTAVVIFKNSPFKVKSSPALFKGLERLIKTETEPYTLTLNMR